MISIFYMCVYIYLHFRERENEEYTLVWILVLSFDSYMALALSSCSPLVGSPIFDILNHSDSHPTHPWKHVDGWKRPFF